MPATMTEINNLRAALFRAGRNPHKRGDLLEFEDSCTGKTVRIIHHDEPAAFDSVTLNGSVGSEYTVPAGWRAVVADNIALNTLCEGATLAELLHALRPYLTEPAREARSPFDGPFVALANDELSTEAISEVQDVTGADGAFLGQTARNDEPKYRGFVARNAHCAKWGDVPGQVTGWAGVWHTRAAAEGALREYGQASAR